MKKYLFNEIAIKHGEIEFRSFRNLSFTEVFSTYKCGPCETSENKNIWVFAPKTLRQFLNCLKITKPNSKGEINLSCELPYDNFIFDDILNLFVKRNFETKRAQEDIVIAFYKKAQEIVQANKSEREIIEKMPDELIK